jgi:hypothetical protein
MSTGFFTEVRMGIPSSRILDCSPALNYGTRSPSAPSASVKATPQEPGRSVVRMTATDLG